MYCIFTKLIRNLLLSLILLFSVESNAQTDESLEYYKKLSIQNSDDAEAHFGLAVAYGKLGRYTEAIDSYKQAIRINPDYADAYYNLGLTYLRLENRNSALDVYKRLEKLDSELANKLFNFIYQQ